MTRARSRRTARRKIKRLIRKTLKIVCAVWDFIARHPAMLAMPLIIFLLVLTIQMHEFEKQVQAWDQEIRQQQEQIEELYDRQDPVEQTDMTDVYGCKSLYGTYDFPWNTMSQDWGSDQVTGFYYHEISEECKAAGGELPTIIQVYTYIVCEQNGVDYEMVFALIEQESRCRWDAEGDNGTSIGLMQVSEKWHMQRMEELGAYDLKNPYQNVLVGVNYLSEIQNDLRGTVPDEDLPYYTLAVYNYGKQGAKANLWDQGVVKYTYNTKIMDRAQQLKEEKKRVNRRYARRSEDTEQMSVMDWARWNQNAHPELELLHHCPNGGSRNKAEAVKLKQMGVKAGIPDLCLPVPMGMYNGLYIEMKYDTGRLEDSQKKMLKALAAAGHYCTVCYGAEEAIRVLQEYINLKKIDTGNREDAMSEQNLMIRKNGKVKCIIFKE